MLKIGIDVGGTFTDVLLHGPSGLWSAKVPTTPSDPAIGAINGIRTVLELAGKSSEDVVFVGHGTTIATNLIVEGKGACAALVTTEGFRDILEIRRSSRHDRADLYDLHFANPTPLVARRYRYEVPERTLFDGRVEKTLTEDAIDKLVSTLADAPVEAVAVCFLHAHIRPDHEQAVVERLHEKLPHLFVCASHATNPEIFEYERTSTVIVNAMLGPRVSEYVKTFDARLADEGISGVIRFMQSNGGLASPAKIANRPISLLQSGPAGGVTAAVKLCKSLGINNVILGDIGGTTFDVSLIRDGEPEVRSSATLQSYIVRAPTIDIESVGAGGGSIAWIDDAGGVHVGPQSAGAQPGPVCYRRGGTQPTLTDCNLLLGYLDPESFPADVQLDVEAARAAVEEHLAGPLRCTAVEAAAIVRAVANANMADAVRLMTVQRGYDPREFAYVCFGGAGPMHAADLARDIDIPSIIVPPFPGLFSAMGMLLADEAHEAQMPIGRPLSSISLKDLEEAFESLCESALALFPAGTAGVDYRLKADCRYVNQAEPLTVAVPYGMSSIDELRRAFEDEHRRRWNFAREHMQILLINLRVTAKVPGGVDLSIRLEPRSSGSAEPHRRRSIYVDGRWADVPAYRREALVPGDIIVAPAIIEEASSSLFFGEGRASVDPIGTLRITRGMH